jgi:hypothetical protein
MMEIISKTERFLVLGILVMLVSVSLYFTSTTLADFVEGAAYGSGDSVLVVAGPRL